VIESYFPVTKDPNRRTLMGHSMGGYGAIINSLRNNFRTFGTTCSFSGGLFVWNLPWFQQKVIDLVVEEAINRPANFTDCNYTQPPYRYYADPWNWNTIVATSLAAVFNPNFRTVPEDNTPWYSFTLFSTNCSVYKQFPGFEFWLDAYGNMNQMLFNLMSVREAPYSYVQRNWPSLQQSATNRIFLSIGYNDTTVEPRENLEFSDLLDSYNITHTMFLYPGTHRDIFEGFAECHNTFRDNFCKAAPVPSPAPEIIASSSPPANTMPYLVGLAVLGIALFATLVVLVVVWIKRSPQKEYSALR